MRQNRTLYLFLTLLASLGLGLAACGTANTAKPTAASAPIATKVLELVSPNGSHIFTLDQLKALPVTEGQGGNKSSAGVITIPAAFKGIAIKDLLSSQGISFDDSMGVTLTAQDGYGMTFSYDQIMNGNFTAYDPATGGELKTHDSLIAILAYEQEGKLLDPVEDGVLRLQVVSSKNNQVVDGHWTEKWVTRVEVKSVGQTWKLKLHGALMQPVDRASFQSCASPSCHGTSWKDSDGQNWVGVPLWYLVGEVDDANSHEANSYNDILADSGYKVDVVGSDGFAVTLESVSIKRNGNMLVAYLVNDAELPEKYYPLRLVGSDLKTGQMVGKIDMIVVHVPEITAVTTAPETTTAPALAPATAAPSAPADASGSLTISGLVANQLSLNEVALRAMGPVTITADQPKKGSQSFTGIRLKALLEVAQIQAGASKLVFSASDGYSSEIDLYSVQSCADCMVAFTDTPGTFFAVMPGQQGSFWVKNVVKIEVK